MSAQKLLQAGPNAVCCSAPGKVLITGGYLILERPNAGLVLTVNARFYSLIEPFAAKGPKTESELSKLNQENGTFIIEVISPQFHHSELYSLKLQPSIALTPL
jgi:phosphomevalonate kinase